MEADLHTPQSIYDKFMTIDQFESNSVLKMQLKGLPHFASGVVIQGFGRGSKELGIPTGKPLNLIIMLITNKS